MSKEAVEVDSHPWNRKPGSAQQQARKPCRCCPRAAGYDEFLDTPLQRHAHRHNDPDLRRGRSKAALQSQLHVEEAFERSTASPGSLVEVVAGKRLG